MTAKQSLAERAPLRVLDLFCGAGGAAMGLHRAWPDAEIVGVDIKPQPRYPFRFTQMDWRVYVELPPGDFDFYWASPPCQYYSVVTPRKDKWRHPDLIANVRDFFKRLEGKPYVIENVIGAKKELREPLMLCGSMFGLRTRRHRLFETSFPCSSPRPCNHSLRPLLVTTAGANSRAIGNLKSTKNAPLAYGIDWMTGDGLKEAIPPAYSEYIARSFYSC